MKCLCFLETNQFLEIYQFPEKRQFPEISNFRKTVFVLGSFGKVKKAKHKKTGHEVAVKILNRNKIKVTVFALFKIFKNCILVTWSGEQDKTRDRKCASISTPAYYQNVSGELLFWFIRRNNQSSFSLNVDHWNF